MSNITNPLQSIINAAAKNLPATTGSVARHTRRSSMIVADVSLSMATPAWGGRTKHDVLREAVMASGHDEIVAFSSVPVVVRPDQLPLPSGSTALHNALDRAILEQPRRLLVISDGEPDDPRAALASARSFDGTIDVLYIGPESNPAAIEFMASLARSGRGNLHRNDIAKASAPALTNTVRGLLA